MTKAEAPERVPAGQLHAGDDIIVGLAAAHILIATHGNTGRGGRSIVLLHCRRASGEFTVPRFSEDIVTRTHAAELVAA